MLHTISSFWGFPSFFICNSRTGSLFSFEINFPLSLCHFLSLSHTLRRFLSFKTCNFLFQVRVCLSECLYVCAFHRLVFEGGRNSFENVHMHIFMKFNYIHYNYSVFQFCMIYSLFFTFSLNCNKCAVFLRFGRGVARGGRGAEIEHIFGGVDATNAFKLNESFEHPQQKPRYV